MSEFIFRNYTIEHLFEKGTHVSGYGDVRIPEIDYDKYILFFQLNPSGTPEDLLKELSDVTGKVRFIINGLPKQKAVIIFTISEYFQQDWTFRDSNVGAEIRQFNDFVRGLSGHSLNRIVVDVDKFLIEQNIESFIDWKFFYLSQMIINPKLSEGFKIWFRHQTVGIVPRKKCIILDCDNTLWGGVVGEDGISGIQLGEDYPGKCFADFQKLLSNVANKGVILGICSKNNLDDVKEVWVKNRFNMVSDVNVSIYRINWDDKATNITSIACELNIGLDSVVFIDDNPVERGLINTLLPDVVTPDFPTKPYLLVDFFWQVYNTYFSAASFTSEDIRKTAQYKENALRNLEKTAFVNMEEYLASLNIVINIFNVTQENVARISQMTQKTNQFNLTTHRYTEADILHFISLNAYVLCANVSDRFGDNGITIAFIGKKENDVVYIDTFLLSCRILGRSIEKYALWSILNHLFDDGVREVTAQFIPTAKNSQVATFLDELGFSLKQLDPDGKKKYALNLRKKFEIKSYYNIILHGRKDTKNDVGSIRYSH